MPTAKELEALALASQQEPTSGNIARLCSKYGEAGRWAFTQAALRKKGVEKFSLALRMLFTREALEQASHEQVAIYHASQFPSGVLIGDLTCGIGGDLIALAARGPTMGFDLSVERLRYAESNLDAYGFQSTLVQADSLAAEWPFEYAFADPSRRVEGVRTLDPAHFQPDPVRLAERMSKLKRAGIKLSPMLDDRLLESLGPRLEFVSFRGECREALVWTGSEVADGREAVKVETGERLAVSPPPEEVSEPLGYFYEADPAAIRAHALGSLGLPGLGHSNGYLTSDKPIFSPWLKSYQVVYHGKADMKTTAKELAVIKSDVPELKQRGIKQDLAAVRRGFAKHGNLKTYVAIWPVGNSLKHTILVPLEA